MKSYEKLKQAGFFEGKIRELENHLEETGYNSHINNPLMRQKLRQNRNLADAVSCLMSPKIITECLKGPTKLFYLDDLVLDSLYNEQHTNPDYSKSLKLPFNFLFVEFENPLKTMNLERENREIGGVFYCRMKEMLEFENIVIEKYLGKEFTQAPKPNSENVYKMMMFMKARNKGEVFSSMENITLDVNSSDFLLTNKKNLIYDSKNKRLVEYNRTRHVLDGKSFEESLIELNDLSAVEYVSKKTDLFVNIINYLNAQNVRTERINRNPDDLQKINNRRINNGKSPLPSLKPYHIIKITKRFHDSENTSGKTWDLNWRVWVRGHFRHYQDGKCTWIAPYVKGPPTAQWKENRYQVLYEQFKDCLEAK